MNCGTLKGWQQHKAANTRCCKWCAPYDPRLANPKKQAVIRKKPGPKPVQKKKAAPKPGKPKRKSPTPPHLVEHGTRAGYTRHWRNKEQACQPCMGANTEFAREQRRKKNPALRDRKPPAHGTGAARSAHYRAGEQVCDVCREAFNASVRTRRATKKERV